MLVLEIMTINVALPSVQADLGFSDLDRQWVLTTYTLASGALLLIGGRIADHLGLTKAFLIGLGGFAVATALTALATNFVMLAAARAAQGACEALLAPTVLAIISVTFTDPRERAKAFAFLTTVVTGGAMLGLVFGGFLIEVIGWRLSRLVSIPIALVAAAGAWWLCSALWVRHPKRLDIPGALLGTAGLVALVAGCGQAVERGLSSAEVIAPLVAAMALLTGFAVWESRVAQPLLPLTILANRNRLGCYLSMFTATAAASGVSVLLSYYLQVALGFSPHTTALASLPTYAAVLLGSQAAARLLLPRKPPRVIIGPSLATAAAGMAWFTQLSPASAYALAVLPGQLLLGIGLGGVFTAATSKATADIARDTTGVGAAVVGAVQNIGGALGVATLNSIAASVTAGYAASSRTVREVEALVHGNAVAAGWAAALLAAAAVSAMMLINAPAPHPAQNPT